MRPEEEANEERTETVENPVDLSASLAELQAAHEELNDRFLRLAADFENYKKRSAKDLVLRVNAALEEFTCEVLEVYDNLERAEQADGEGLREGLVQIRKLFGAILERRGITPIESLNRRFDPAYHDAIAYVASDAEEGTVIDEIRRGYCMNDRVIRCAKVAVSKGKE
ncbi:MAG TPA: nucleotide exchange factor GrpE [Methanoregulaceae archaeon]|nr:nucleotide exchange factor GrpE [Methanoregulaceae archaeon]